MKASPMNDGHDAIYFVRTYTDPKSQQARDRWLAFRTSAGMPVRQQLERFDTVPNEFAKQYERMKVSRDSNRITGGYEAAESSVVKPNSIPIRTGK